MKDFHIHFHLDACGAPEMTMENIERACIELGIDEACIVKHYSARMPNGKNDWICWHVTAGDALERFLAEYRAYAPSQVKFHCGVETELLNDRGDINIPLSDQAKVDIVQCSIHFMIDTEKLPMTLMLYPDLNFTPEHNNEDGRRQLAEWKEKVDSVGAEYLISAVANGYRNAIIRNPGIKSLSHMADGMKALRLYLVDVASVPVSRQVEIFEPLMKLMAERNIFWEIADEPAEKAIIRRAHELGVTFTATADGHQLHEGWGPLSRHINAENRLKSLLEQ